MLASQAAASFAPGVDGVRETLCRVMIQRGQAVETVDAPGVHVLEQAAAAGGFAPQLPEGASSLGCGRTSIVPAPHDDEVLLLGLPFYIVEVGGAERIGVLEISQGQFRYRMIRGELGQADMAAVQARLNEFQDRLQDAAD